MANIKISALPTLSSMSDSVTFPVVDSGSTQKTLASNIKSYVLSGTVTADSFHATNNGNGTNFQVGDDAWIGDVNVANTLKITGQQDPTQGYILFGNTGNVATLGRSGSGPITANANFTVTGTTTSGNLITTSGVFWSNGTPYAGTYSNANVASYLTANPPAGTYGNANVAAYLPTYNGNVGVSNLVQTSTGQITSAVGSNGNVTINPDGTGWFVVTSVTPSYFGNTVTITNNKTLNFKTTNGSNVSLIQQNDDNLVLYSTDASSAQRAIWSVFANSGTSTFNVSAPIQVKDVRDTVYDLGTTGGNIAPNGANGDIQTITCNAAITINGFTSPVSGQTITLIINQGTGGFALTSNMKFAGGYKTLSTAANAIDILHISYIGSTYYASLVTGYV